MIQVNVVPGSGFGAFPTASNGPKLTRSQRPAGSDPRALSVPLQLDPAERTEGSGGVTVTAGSGCSWTASSSATGWLTCTPASGTGNGSVSYSVTANTSSTARSATLTIAGQAFTVNQDAASCSYSISPTSASPASGAVSGSVMVIAGTGCSWTASSSATGWLTCTPASGAANGTVS